MADKLNCEELIFQKKATPSNPKIGKLKVFVNPDGALCTVDENGTVTNYVPVAAGDMLEADYAAGTPGTPGAKVDRALAADTLLGFGTVTLIAFGETPANDTEIALGETGEFVLDLTGVETNSIKIVNNSGGPATCTGIVGCLGAHAGQVVSVTLPFGAQKLWFTNNSFQFDLTMGENDTAFFQARGSQDWAWYPLAVFRNSETIEGASLFRLGKLLVDYYPSSWTNGGDSGNVPEVTLYNSDGTSLGTLSFPVTAGVVTEVRFTSSVSVNLVVPSLKVNGTAVEVP